MVVTKQQFNKKIGEFIEPKFTIRYIKNSELVECKALCDLRNLKVPKPPKKPDMTEGNLTIQKLTNIISKVFDEKNQPIQDEISLIKQKRLLEKMLFKL
ncbi:hypothetical protein ACJA27_03180 [Mycoplasmopsis lipophila]|uniref:hypothetical protein n=1 Tax=Mycoplasmopsis lipophila TaxID=2117 RepID=UPI003873109A